MAQRFVASRIEAAIVSGDTEKLKKRFMAVKNELGYNSLAIHFFVNET
jgi:hypothetical protein